MFQSRLTVCSMPQQFSISESSVYIKVLALSFSIDSPQVMHPDVAVLWSRALHVTPASRKV